MLETLVINGKLYQPSDRAASLVDKPVFYLEQLAREKWVEAAFVHGQYFFELDSLVRFIQNERTEYSTTSMEREKKQFLTEQLLNYKNSIVFLEPGSTWHLLTQSGVVVLCGCLIGLISWSALEAGLSAAVFKSGLNNILLALQTQILP